MALNAQQQAVIEWISLYDGSLNLEARAGCGKTYTLMEVVREIIRVQPKASVALMAYNKSASEEFKSRLANLGLNSPMVTPGTVHSFGNRAWRRAAGNFQVDDKKVDKIVYNRRDEEGGIFQEFAPSIIKLVSMAKQHAVGVTSSIDDRDVWRKLLAHYDIESNGSVEEIVDAAIDIFRDSLSTVYEVIDFDDMVLVPLLKKVSIFKHDWVLIDEAQDTNESRRLLALAMLKPGGRLIAVGDPKQAIYGFTGADSDSLDLIRNVLNSKVLPLSITYRCPKAVVAEANKLVPDLIAHESAPEGAVRKLQVVNPENETPWFVSEAVTADDVALCRNTAPLLEAAYSLISRGIGCKVEGRNIGEGLIQLASRWRRVVSLVVLSEKIEEWKEREMQKWMDAGNESRAQAAEDKAETLQVIIKHLTDSGLTTVNDLVSHIRNLFGDTKTGEAPSVFTLATIHRSKGREWDRVYLLHRNKTLPSKYAKQAWQKSQENNLLYVAQTRAKRELVYVD